MNRYKIGQSATYEKVITDADVRGFAEITGDKNPVHLDDEYASKSRFNKRIAHGFLTGAMISKILGMDFPGPGTVYLSQSMKFLAPCYIGENLKAVVTVTDINEEKKNMTLSTEIFNSEGKLILTGEAKVIPPM